MSNAPFSALSISIRRMLHARRPKMAYFQPWLTPDNHAREQTVG